MEVRVRVSVRAGSRVGSDERVGLGVEALANVAVTVRIRVKVTTRLGLGFARVLVGDALHAVGVVGAGGAVGNDLPPVRLTRLVGILPISA